MSPERPDYAVLRNEEFWNAQPIVASQSDHPFLYWHEEYLVNEARSRLEEARREVGLVHVVGCGTGRELPGIRAAFPRSHIIGTDVAPNMIAACRANLGAWGLREGIELRCCPASSLRPEARAADLIVVLNNVLTYITPVGERVATVSALRRLSRGGALLIGGVHQRWGQPLKSLYFLAQGIAARMGVLRGAVGDRVGGRPPYRLLQHYFTRSELRALFSQAGFAPLATLSLAELAAHQGREYSRLRGDDNLLFIAEAR